MTEGVRLGVINPLVQFRLHGCKPVKHAFASHCVNSR